MSNNPEPQTYGAPTIERLRLETVRRNLVVRHVTSLTPRMLRVTLAGDELSGFVSPSPDDHIKLFFPTTGGGMEMRDYTPRRFDPVERTLAIDFALHEGGVGSAWAQGAKPGDSLQIGGPRGSSVISAADAWWLLIGDETVLNVLNQRLCGRSEAAATCLALRIAANGEATLANAGHLPPYLNGEPVEIEGSLPLGIAESVELTVLHFRLREGDRLVLMSDGIPEATDVGGKLFGFERVHALLRDAVSAAALATAAQNFGQEDDISVIAITRTAALATVDLNFGSSIAPNRSSIALAP